MRGRLHRDDRPWGRFELYAENEPCTVKVITMAPGCRLSLQRHQERDELWVMLDDGLQVEIDGQVSFPRAGEEFFIRRGTTHRVTGGERPARLLEVAFGTFDEDDIERLEDDFGRAGHAVQER